MNPTPDQIKTARLNAGLTWAQAADLVHCHIQTWAKWERGERQMHPAFWDLFKIRAKESG